MCKEALTHLKRDLDALVRGFYESFVDFPHCHKGIIQFDTDISLWCSFMAKDLISEEGFLNTKAKSNKEG